jgi:hypothetical protein
MLAIRTPNGIREDSTLGDISPQFPIGQGVFQASEFETGQITYL